MAPSLIEFAKHMARDPVALDSLSMERTSASYKFTFGLAKTLQEDLVSEVASARFYSLNLDEAMSSNHQKVLAVLISFFSEAHQKVVIQHLGSLSLTRVDSCSVVSALEDLLSKNGLKWERCLSILMDSCNVMRGKKNGVEARLRNTVAPHLLDIDGDSCHHIHGCCKKFTSAFGGIIERLFSDIFCDFKYSPVFQQSLQGICEILDTKYTMPQRFLSHRWLSVLDLTDDTLRLLDCYTQLYYEFLPKSDKTIYHSVLVDILQKQHVTMEGRQEIRRLRAEVGKTSLTSDGKERKARILKSLFYDRDNTLMQLKFFSSVLPLFKEFVLLFQRQDPQIHILHERQVALFREFLVFFLQPERMRSHGKPLSVKELLQLQIEDKSEHLPSDLIFVGKASAILHKKDTSDQASFRATCKEAFIAGAQALQEKLPLANGFLRAANGLNPALDSNSALRKMLTLPSFVPGVFCKDGLDETSTEDAEATYDKEVRKFVHECQSSPPADNQRIDEWWANIFNANPKAFPHLQQVVKAVLCCFHGPVVESTFNLMGDVLDERSGRMAMETVSAFQTVKYSIKASGKSSLQLFRRNDVKRDPVNATLHQNMEGAHSMYLKRLEQHREDRARKLAQFKSEQAKVASKRKAIEASRSSAKKARLSHLKKQAHSRPTSSNSKSM